MNLKNRQQLLAVSAIALVVFFALDKLVLTPLTDSWKERAATIAQLKKSIKQGQGILDLEKGLQQRWNEIRKGTLPLSASAAEAELLKAFDQWSADSRISVNSIRPQWKAGASDDYSTVECRVDAAGSLQTLMRFIYEIEKSPLALRVDSVEITARDNNGQQLALGLLVSGLRLAPFKGK